MSSQQFTMLLRRTGFSSAIKRCMDIVASAVGLIFLAPALLIISVAIKLTSPGPILYNARRVGRYGKLINVRKFRTMIANADAIGPAVTGRDDIRVTNIGKFLRDWKLDELPQLINVLEGSMSLVGPRPEDPRYVALYTEDQRRILSVRPGITSPASLAYRHEGDILVGDEWETYYVQHVMQAKLAIDLEYVDRAGPIYDIVLIIRTLIQVIR